LDTKKLEMDKKKEAYIAKLLARHTNKSSESKVPSTESDLEGLSELGNHVVNECGGRSTSFQAYLTYYAPRLILPSQDAYFTNSSAARSSNTATSQPRSAPPASTPQNQP
jgi:hypothetical protein